MTSSDLRIAFAGTPDFAAGHLEHLCRLEFNIVGVFSQPDRPSGRGKATRPTPVKTVAESHGLPIFQPETLDSSAKDSLIALAPDVLVVVAFGMILSEEVLQIPRLGCINVHASLLPRWRGAAPIEHAMLAGDAESGISIMQMNAGLDTGPVLLAKSTLITSDDNGESLTERLMQLGCEGLVEALGDLPALQETSTDQDDSRATYASKLSKPDALIDWSQPALTIQRQVQAFYPRSPAWCPFQGDRLRIIRARQVPQQDIHPPGTITEIDKSTLSVACGKDALEVSMLQLPGKKAASIADILNGHPELFQQGSTLQGS